MSNPQNTGGGGRRPPPDELDAIRRELIAAAVPDEYRPFVETMNAQAISPESQLTALHLLAGVKVGSAWNGYTMARLDGKSRLEARDQAATALHLALVRVLGPDGHTGPRADEYRAALEAALPKVQDTEESDELA